MGIIWVMVIVTIEGICNKKINGIVIVIVKKTPNVILFWNSEDNSIDNNDMYINRYIICN